MCGWMCEGPLVCACVKGLLLQAARASGGVLLAHEGIDGTIGAGNALMACTRNASIMQTWYDRYRDFSDAIWNGFSRHARSPSPMHSENTFQR